MALCRDSLKEEGPLIGKCDPCTGNRHLSDHFMEDYALLIGLSALDCICHLSDVVNDNMVMYAMGGEVFAMQIETDALIRKPTHAHTCFLTYLSSCCLLLVWVVSYFIYFQSILFVSVHGLVQDCSSSETLPVTLV